MLTSQQLQNEILKLKKLNDICILAHSYQTHDIIEVADFVGDSFALSQMATTAPNKTVVMCGVRFMAETAKILSPEKKVLLSHTDAGCAMAEQMTVDEIKALKRKHPDAAVVAYINTTSLLKTECDICVTSASALKIVKKIPNKKIIFIPDCNLGGWVKEQVPEKEFIFVDGGCPVHKRITVKDVENAKKRYPNAKLLVHPECLNEVSRLADYVGSTTGIMEYAKNSTDKEFIIGTENNIATHLMYELPDKKFYTLSKDCVCNDMRLTTLIDLYNCVNGTGGDEIVLDNEVMQKAKNCIDVMLSYGG